MPTIALYELPPYSIEFIGRRLNSLQSTGYFYAKKSQSDFCLIIIVKKSSPELVQDSFLTVDCAELPFIVRPLSLDQLKKESSGRSVAHINRLFQQEDATWEEASRILSLKEMNDKAKSI